MGIGRVQVKAVQPVAAKKPANRQRASAANNIYNFSFRGLNGLEVELIGKLSAAIATLFSNSITDPKIAEQFRPYRNDQSNPSTLIEGEIEIHGRTAVIADLRFAAPIVSQQAEIFRKAILPVLQEAGVRYIRFQSSNPSATANVVALLDRVRPPMTRLNIGFFLGKMRVPVYKGGETIDRNVAFLRASIQVELGRIEAEFNMRDDSLNHYQLSSRQLQKIGLPGFDSIEVIYKLPSAEPGQFAASAL